MPETRRLAAILAADLHPAAIGTFTAQHASMHAAIARFQGRPLAHPGASLVAELTSIVDALECAVFLARTPNASGGEHSGEPVAVRVGVSVGDLLVDGDRRSGDALTIAIRLPQFVEPGGIA